MLQSQFHPLKTNASTGELYLPLEYHPNIILTTPRLSDIPKLPDLLNDPGVCIWLRGPPYPYEIEHSEEWVTKLVEETEEILQELKDAEGNDTLKLVGGSPVRCIREIKEDGTDVLIGDIHLRRCETMELAPGMKNDSESWEDSPKLLGVANMRRENGDPEILWSVGYFLATSHSGQGIMTSAFKAILEQWAIPRMGIRRMIGETYAENFGSQRVLEKNGFVFREIVKEHLEAKGKKHDICVFDLNVSL
ncbi:acyl-CoA N-acyltransferase [Lentinula aff. detonsa]|uniref:Acyl-CoA N-acyltransferase n=1 Tax=Lentinula aff. detonsa TaxID=2804958 RepID=A0AA38TZ51_9AGAR|nr:acyl-CoA N-acyltransferase [Lentinula aff. detonsa]